MIKQIFFLINFIIFLNAVYSKNILAIFPHKGKSHYIVFEPLVKELAIKGHNVTIISQFGHEETLPPSKNFRHISVAGTNKNQLPIIYLDEFDFVFKTLKPYLEIQLLAEWGIENCEDILQMPIIKQILNEKFDLFITEHFNTDCFLSIPYLLKIPHVAMSSCTIMPHHYSRFGIPDNPSYIPQNLLFFSDQMNFFQRTSNFLSNILSNYLFAPYFMTKPATRLASKHLNTKIPYLEDVAKTTSLMLVNTYFPFNLVKPLPPNVIEIGGIHLKKPRPLSNDIKKFIEESKNGVILFSFGSLLTTRTMEESIRNAFIDAFAQLPQRVVWKYENDTMPNATSQIMIKKWIPQNDILNHINVVLFISHCGLGGSIEGVNRGIPMICIPFFGDQYINAAALEKNGVALNLNYEKLNKNIILNALKTVLTPKFKENAKRLSKIYNDRPMPPLETAVWWVEYVMRNDGAKYLQPFSVQLNLFQYLLLDVILFLLSIFLIFLFILKKFTQKMFIVKKKQKLH